MTGDLAPSRLHPGDAIRASTSGLRTRRTRSLLSALGILVGIAAMIAVLGLSESSKSDLLAQLDRLGTNLLRVQATEGIGLSAARLPKAAVGMTGRVSGVEEVSAQVDLAANVFRTDYIPPTRTAGLTVKAVDTGILGTLKGTVAEGRFLDAAAARYPVAVLGWVAAERLAITDLSEQPRVWIRNQWFSVIGILSTLDLNPDLDRSAIIGIPAAETHLGSDGAASTIFVRTDPGSIDHVLGLLASAVNPEHPDQVQASRPTEALEARAAAASAFTELLLGLGAVALLVGAVGIANIMVISVLERRSEIGLRRALGATKRHIAIQFLTESLLLAAIGGIAGVATGTVITLAYARIRGWGVILPAQYLGAGIATALLIGALAGVYPALRAARMSPTEALRTV
jgi:putative ABC transport system permease protein